MYPTICETLCYASMHEAAQAIALFTAMPILLTVHRYVEWDENLHGGEKWWWFAYDHEVVDGEVVWKCWMWYLEADMVEFPECCRFDVLSMLSRLTRRSERARVGR